jgi:hypothetical protein
MGNENKKPLELLHNTLMVESKFVTDFFFELESYYPLTKGRL